LKKSLATTLLVLLIIFSMPLNAFAFSAINKVESVPKNTKEIIYRDMVISLLVPYMQKEINIYYKEYLTELPIIFPYSVDIVNVVREEGGGFLMKLEVIAHPFVGPINTVGDDRMIIETGAFGSVSIKKFEHIKSYPLPWNWQHIIKKPY